MSSTMEHSKRVGQGAQSQRGQTGGRRGRPGGYYGGRPGRGQWDTSQRGHQQQYQQFYQQSQVIPGAQVFQPPSLLPGFQQSQGRYQQMPWQPNSAQYAGALIASSPNSQASEYTTSSNLDSRLSSSRGKSGAMEHPGKGHYVSQQPSRPPQQGSPPRGRLYDCFEVRKDPRRFFVRGRVFKAAPPELAGRSTDSQSSCSRDTLGQSVHSKPRIYIVVNADKLSCNAVPITSYGGKGVAKKKVTKAHHAIVHTTKEPPLPTPGERANVMGGERPMQPHPIRIAVREDAPFQLDDFSRVDLAHTVKIDFYTRVWDVGAAVDPVSMLHFDAQFRAVRDLMNPGPSGLPLGTAAMATKCAQIEYPSKSHELVAILADRGHDRVGIRAFFTQLYSEMQESLRLDASDSSMDLEEEDEAFVQEAIEDLPVAAVDE